jgi:hypothetical protein
MAASTATAYRNSGDSQSANQRHFFTRAEIENFFETCPAELLSRRFRHFLRGMWIAAGRPFGADVQLFKAVGDYRKACYYRSDSTVRYNLRAAEDLGLLEIAHRDRRGNCHHIWIRPRTDSDNGLYRRVTTHRLPISLLMQWRQAHRAESAGEVTPIRKPALPTAPPPKSPAPAAPAPQRATPAAEKPEHRSTERAPQPKLTKRDCAKFVANMAVVMKGCTHSEYGTELEPGDPRYRPKLSWRAALSAVCERWHRTEESVIEALKFWGYQMEASP